MDATAWGWHTAECWAWRWLDVAHGCICRPPFAREPKAPTPEEVVHAKRVHELNDAPTRGKV